MSWEVIALGAGGVGTTIGAFLGGLVAAKKLVTELRGKPPEGESPASLASIQAIATEARDEAKDAKEAATRAENKIDAHLQSHADSDVRTPRVRLVRGDPRI